MKITDSIYGNFEINEPVLAEIIKTKEMQRLKGVSQGAIFFLHPKITTTRFEHGVGVCLLLRSLGAQIEEQIAGLIHDISHTAFSHVIDHVFKTKEENYHEEQFNAILSKSKIPEILSKHGFDLAKISDESNFHLLEKPLPDLCADRIDYFLRDSVSWGALDLFQSKRIFSSLTAFGDSIVFNSQDIALESARKFMRMDLDFWALARHGGAYEVLAEAIRLGLDSGAITKDDLFTEDAYVLEKLRNSGNKEILSDLSLLKETFAVEVFNKPGEGILSVQKKLRYIDPLVLSEDSPKKLSELNRDFRKQLSEYVKNSTDCHFIRINR